MRNGCGRCGRASWDAASGQPRICYFDVVQPDFSLSKVWNYKKSQFLPENLNGCLQNMFRSIRRSWQTLDAGEVKAGLVNGSAIWGGNIGNWFGPSVACSVKYKAGSASTQQYRGNITILRDWLVQLLNDKVQMVKHWSWKRWLQSHDFDYDEFVGASPMISAR